MSWTVELKDSVLDDLRWFGRKEGRLILDAALEVLEKDPLAETRNLKTLRPNPFAEREVRLSGNYRVCSMSTGTRNWLVIMAVGEKRGEKLLVQGKEFVAHHENSSSE